MDADQHFDVLWIGTGQATMTVVPRLASARKKVAIIEGGNKVRIGITCRLIINRLLTHMT